MRIKENKMSTTVTKETIFVEGVNPRANSKFKTSGGLFVNGGWINTAETVGIEQFKKNKEYSVGVVTENGKKLVVEVYTAPTVTASSTTEKAGDMPATPKASKGEWSGAEAGGIMHDAVALAAGMGLTGDTLETALQRVEAAAEGLLRIKRSLQG